MYFVIYEIATAALLQFVFSLKWNDIILNLGQYWYNASESHISIKSDTHEQAEWYINTLSVQAIHNII